VIGSLVITARVGQLPWQPSIVDFHYQPDFAHPVAPMLFNL
jgi:hypothetical protein